MLFHVTTDLFWPAKAEIRVVVKSVSTNGQDGRNDQFWDKHETIGSGGGGREPGTGNQNQMGGGGFCAGKIVVTRLLDSEM